MGKYESMIIPIIGGLQTIIINNMVIYSWCSAHSTVHEIHVKSAGEAWERLQNICLVLIFCQQTQKTVFEYLSLFMLLILGKVLDTETVLVLAMCSIQLNNVTKPTFFQMFCALVSQVLHTAYTTDIIEGAVIPSRTVSQVTDSQSTEVKHYHICTTITEVTRYNQLRSTDIQP